MTALNFQGTVQFRRGNASDWATQNPTLAQAELGVELDTGKFKIGNGNTPWNTLPYGFTPPSPFSVYPTFAAATAQPPIIPGLVRVVADETNGGNPTAYFFDGTEFQWIVSL